MKSFYYVIKLKKEDIKVRFFEEESDWEAYGDFNPAEIHHQVAIVLKTPPYQTRNVKKTVYIELVRPSDSKVSEARQFEYIPDEEDGMFLDRKMRNMQTACVVKNEPSEISRKRKRTDPEEGAESSASDSAYSSVMDSPQSSEDEPLFPEIQTSMDIGSDVGSYALSQFLELVDEDSLLEEKIGKTFARYILSQDEDPAIEGQMVNTFAHNIPSQNEVSTIEGQMGNTFAFNVPSQDGNFRNLEQIFAQCYIPVVEADGMDGILSSMDSMSLAGQQEQEMQKASNDFVVGMKRILESRGERTFLHYAAQLIPLDDEDGNSMLHLGIMEQNENWNFIWKMVEMASEDIINSQNKFKETALHLAIKGNHVKILLLLLARGGDPNLSDRNGNNCLHLAAKYGHIKCLKVLLPPSGFRRTWKHAISDIDIVNYDGMSALHIAVTENFEECVNFLLSSKADVNLPEKKCGRACLHLAIERPSLLKAILKQPDVDIDAEDFGGCTAVQLACLKTGKSFEVVSSMLKDDKDKIAEFLESCRESSNDNSSSEEETDEGSTSEFEDAVEDFGSISSSEVVCKAVSTSERTCTNEKKSSLMKIEEELHKYLDRDDNWKKLANFIGLDTRRVALLDEGLSSGQTVLRKIKVLDSQDLYHPCHLQTMIQVLQFAGLEDGVQILQKNS
ncbi:unnamed protein product [Larinioides sclopetarius]|uniref:Rel homology dimerisation domain-containing protein n=1 Tax=Larinioides sclopetarius TaxID=280406 RepID=A0AAV2BSX5_9ARAC